MHLGLGPRRRRAAAGQLELGLARRRGRSRRSRSTMNRCPGRRRPAARRCCASGRSKHPGLGAERDPAVLGHQPAARAQAVAVEGGADLAAVAGDDRRRPVPRLGQRGVVAVEAVRARRAARRWLSWAIGTIIISACGSGAPGRDQQLEPAVEGGRVRDALRRSAAGTRRAAGRSRASAGSTRARASSATLPRRVLISPLWALRRGAERGPSSGRCWSRSASGRSRSALRSSGSREVGVEVAASCGAVSMPL